MLQHPDKALCRGGGARHSRALAAFPWDSGPDGSNPERREPWLLGGWGGAGAWWKCSLSIAEVGYRCVCVCQN